MARPICSVGKSQYVSSQEKNGEAFYIAIWTNAHDCDGFDQDRKKSYTLYRINKKDLVRVWRDTVRTSLTIKFVGDTYIDTFDADGTLTFPIPYYVTGGTGLSPKYKGDELEITITLNNESIIEQTINSVIN